MKAINHSASSDDRRRYGISIGGNGFTLVELVVVMILVAMLSGLFIYSVKGHIDAAAIETSVQRIHSLDRRLRIEARRSEQPATVQFRSRDISIESSMELADAGIKANQKLSGNVSVDSVRIDRAAGDIGRRNVAINRRGQSANYALHLTTDNGANTWLVTLGISGQQLRCNTREEVDALLRP